MAQEAKLQSEVLKFLKGLDVYAIKVISGNKAGVPDILSCIDGNFVGIEVKSDKGIQSKLQKYNQQKIEMEGGRYFLLSPKTKSIVFQELRRLSFSLPENPRP